jgi:hypothetical protein
MLSATFRKLLTFLALASMLAPTAVQARFLQVDPVGYADQVNLYEYVKDDPINSRDPSGKEGGPEPTYEQQKIRSEAALEFGRDHPNVTFALGTVVAAGMTEGLAPILEEGAAAYRAARFEQRLEKVRERLSGWKETPNRKGVGSRFQDPANQGNRVRVDRGNPDHDLPSQRPDHVVQQRGGQTVNAEGKPIQAPKPASTPEAHIPLKEWLNKPW